MRTERSRRWSPLVGGLLAMLMAVFLLPSALNVPQSNPTQTLEFAPIPPEDDTPPPETGNVASLSLGSSSTAPASAVGGDGPGQLPTIPLGVGDIPITKRCVGNPPRQTEDPMAPPCVAHFEGSNGGATHRGVESDEVRVLFYLDPQIWTQSDRGSENEGSLAGRYFDLSQAPTAEETQTLRNLRRFQAFFNERYQTYDRRVVFWAYFAPGDENGATTAETRQADATDNLAEVDPFAVLTTGMVLGYEEQYLSTLAAADVLVFGSQAGVQPQAFFDRFPGLIWSYLPTVERQAQLFATYACTQVVGRPVVDSGNSGENGGPRTLGLVSTSDQRKPHLIQYGQEVKQRMLDCGAQFAEEVTFSQAGAATQARNSEDPAALYATQNVALLQQADVTTVIWAGGFETDQSKAAARAEWFPEWVLAGDGELESRFNGGGLQDQEAWEHAWVSSTVVREFDGDEGPNHCSNALREADPEVGTRDEGWACSFLFYRDLRQLFTGIQVAGPRLTPGTIEQGFRAIPAKASVDATIPACFYEPGDYTCVKDATAMWWDPDADVGTTTTRGCYRMIEAGRRYLAGTWPDVNIDGLRRPDDPCNFYDKPVLAF